MAGANHIGNLERYGKETEIVNPNAHPLERLIQCGLR